MTVGTPLDASGKQPLETDKRPKPDKRTGLDSTLSRTILPNHAPTIPWARRAAVRREPSQPQPLSLVRCSMHCVQ
jgi:hypothetical protein